MTTFLKRHWAVLTAAIAITLAFPSLNLFPLAWVALVPLFARATAQTPRETARDFFYAGTLFHWAIMHWVLVQIYWAGAWVLLGLVLAGIYYGLWWAVFGFLWRWSTLRLPFVPAALAAALLWIAMEHLQVQRFVQLGSGGLLAYSQGPNFPAAQWAAIGGAPLLGGFVVGVNALLGQAAAARARRLVPLFAAAAVFAAVHIFGYLMLRPADYAAPYTVGLIQSDFPVEMKHDPEHTIEMIANAAAKSRVLAAHEPFDLLVWPEALVMRHYEDARVLEVVKGLVADIDRPLYSGAQRNEADRTYNSSFLIEPDGTVRDYYDKIHLMAFGEYVPFGRFLRFVTNIVGDMDAGTEPRVMEAAGRRFGPLICFEVVFPAMARDLQQRGADFLVVVTNLGWFGKSIAIPLEFEMSRFRAIETRLPLVHSANTGISGVFDPYGRFTLINGLVTADGRFFRIDPSISPSDTVMQRLAGALPVPAAARALFPAGPVVIPWACVIVGLVVLVAALVFRRARTSGAPESP
ncbi:MAG: apolipoprotein N-acyltransferase [Candidatus Hydrogenedentales bacterium]